MRLSRKKKQRGLSLIESAMVLALSAVVISGVLYYYNNAKEKHAVNESIKQIQTIAATVNKLYAGRSEKIENGTDMSNLVKAISEVSGIPTVQSNGTTYFKSPTGIYTQLWGLSDGRKYALETQARDASTCIAYAALNLGTLMKGKTLVGAGNSLGSQQPTAGGALTPAEAAQQCENAAKQSGDGNPIKIRYHLGY